MILEDVYYEEQFQSWAYEMEYNKWVNESIEFAKHISSKECPICKHKPLEPISYDDAKCNNCGVITKTKEL